MTDVIDGRGQRTAAYGSRLRSSAEGGGQTILGRKDFTRQELDDARANVEARLKAFRTLAKAAADQKTQEALHAFEPGFVNDLVLALDRPFVHRLRMATGKDTNPLNEVELIAELLIHHAAGRRSRTPGARRRSSPRALDAARLPGRPPRRGRAHQDVAARARDVDDPCLAPSLARGDAVEAEAESLPLPGIRGRIAVRWDD